MRETQDNINFKIMSGMGRRHLQKSNTLQLWRDINQITVNM